MKRAWLSFLLLWTAAAPGGAEPAPGAMLNLNCVAALAAVGHADLAGVFSFVSEKDAPMAFADFIVHNKAAMKKYIGKVEKDFKAAAGVVAWDHEVIMYVLELYASPLGDVLGKPGWELQSKLTELSAAPTLSLAELTSRKKN